MSIKNISPGSQYTRLEDDHRNFSDCEDSPQHDEFRVKPNEPRRGIADSVDTSCFRGVDRLYVVAPIILFVTIALGAVFYYIFNPGWDPALCYFYACQALFGVMYGTPGDERPFSKGFTMIFYLWGQFLLLSAFAVMVEEMIEKSPKILHEERMKIIEEEERRRLDTESCSIKYDVANCLVYINNFILSEIGNQMFFHSTLVVIWLLVGTYGAMFIWGSNFLVGFYFALDAISVAGVAPPFCLDDTLNDDCILSPGESIFTGTYILVGVPLFALFMVTIAEAIIDKMIRVKERNAAKVHKLLSDNDFDNAIRFYGAAVSSHDESDTNSAETVSMTRPQKLSSRLVIRGDVNDSSSDSESSKENELKVSLNDFVVMEMLRRKVIDQSMLEEVKLLFKTLDHKDKGEVKLRHLTRVAEVQSSF